MRELFTGLIASFTATLVGVLLLAVLLTNARRLGRLFVHLSTRAPLLDVWVAMLTWVPWVLCVVLAGWVGFVGAILGQMLAMGVWCLGHEMVNREAARGPRIVKFLNRTVGRGRNHLALWVTLVALPGFWAIRFSQMVAYWPLVKLLKFPDYKQSEWINVSRQKFDGLVGHDLIWCLYCDWMTGVYSLGAEMLRNVESFWCPIRYYDGKKCDNCKVDFPDIANGWVDAQGTMKDVEQVMIDKYAGDHRSWFGHPDRVQVTVKGEKVP